MHRLDSFTESHKDGAHAARGMCMLNHEEDGNILAAGRHMTKCHIHGHDLQTKDEQTENAMRAYYFKKQEEQRVSSLPQSVVRDKLTVSRILL